MSHPEYDLYLIPKPIEKTVEQKILDLYNEIQNAPDLNKTLEKASDLVKRYNIRKTKKVVNDS
jgi:hypothetical protein